MLATWSGKDLPPLEIVVIGLRRRWLGADGRNTSKRSFIQGTRNGTKRAAGVPNLDRVQLVIKGMEPTWRTAWKVLAQLGHTSFDIRLDNNNNDIIQPAHSFKWPLWTGSPQPTSWSALTGKTFGEGTCVNWTSGMDYDYTTSILGT